MMDGGMRIKHMRLDPAHWDLLEVGGDIDANINRAREWITEHESQGYDYLGLLGFVARVLGQDKARWTCSEAVAAMLGMPDAWRFDPCTLYAALSRPCGHEGVVHA